MSVLIELAHTSFEDLLKMKNKLGTKIYRENVLAKLAEPEDDEQPDESDDSSEEEARPKPKLQKKPDFSRTNRGEPIEASSKRIDYRYNFASRPKAVIGKKKREELEHRDPRFDTRCGQFDTKKFQKGYGFINDMKRNEIELLRKELKKTKNETRRGEIQAVIRRLQNQLRAAEEQQNVEEITHKVKSKLIPESEATTAAAVSTKSDSSKPKVFVNKSLVKKTALAEKFKKLKESGQLEKYLAKKRKKNASKDRRFMARKRE